MPEHLVFIGVGSNIEPEENIPRALELLAAKASIEAVSVFYRTPALLRPELPPFLNGVVQVRTGLDARTLKVDVLQNIEAALGRVRTGDAYGSRPIDLDILLFDAEVIETPELRVPDPDIRKRPFVAIPLVELVPDATLPGLGERVADLPCARERDEMSPADAFTKVLRERLGL